MSEDPTPIPVEPVAAPETARKVTFDSLQAKAVEFLKNPVVLAGSAVVVGLVVARVAGGSKLRGLAVNAITEFLKVKAVSKFVQPAEPPVEPVTPPTPTPTTSGTPAAVATLLGKKILEAVGPQLGELAKKKLAQLFPNQH